MSNENVLDVDGIVISAIRSNSLAKQETVAEAYVAEQKPYRQVSEFVSQKTKDAHVALYKEYIRTLNAVSAEIDAANSTVTNSNHSEYRSCKLDEVYNLNAVWLHELYFANCFDPNSQIFMDSKAHMRLQRDWGTFDDFQRDFIACAMSCGEGWAVCAYNMFLKRYVNTFISNNSQDVMVGIYPVLVLDVHTHAFFRDYLTDRKSYVVAMMRQINWNVVEERFLKAEAINEALK